MQAKERKREAITCTLRGREKGTDSAMPSRIDAKNGMSSNTTHKESVMMVRKCCWGEGTNSGGGTAEKTLLYGKAG